jgi:hypothetical protein
MSNIEDGAKDRCREMADRILLAMEREDAEEDHTALLVDAHDLLALLASAMGATDARIAALVAERDRYKRYWDAAQEDLHYVIGTPRPLGGLHANTADLVDRFAVALKEKLSAAEAKYGYSDGWMRRDWMDECRAKLVEHVAKGDPRDVAAYCAFLWHHGESTAPARNGGETGEAP